MPVTPETAGMPRRGLETSAYQFDRLDGLAGAQQEAALNAMLADIDTQARNIETLAAAWRSGDTRTLEGLLMDGFTDAPADNGATTPKPTYGFALETAVAGDEFELAMSGPANRTTT